MADHSPVWMPRMPVVITAEAPTTSTEHSQAEYPSSSEEVPGGDAHDGQGPDHRRRTR
jgi:hypothetical protein